MQKKKMREHKKIGKKESDSGVFFLFNFFFVRWLDVNVAAPGLNGAPSQSQRN